MSVPFLVRGDADGLLIRVKVVPGASADAIVGPSGDRLRVRVAAPPEDGRANAALESLLAKSLGVAARAVAVEAGHHRAEKHVRVRGVPVEALAPFMDLGAHGERGR